MKLKKNIIIIISVFFMPIFVAIVLGMLQGAWFDAEENMQRIDAEMYKPSHIQLFIYYMISLVLAVFSSLSIYYLYRKTNSVFLRFFYSFFWIATFLILIFFVFSVK